MYLATILQVDTLGYITLSLPVEFTKVTKDANGVVTEDWFVNDTVDIYVGYKVLTTCRGKSNQRRIMNVKTNGFLMKRGGTIYRINFFQAYQFQNALNRAFNLVLIGIMQEQCRSQFYNSLFMA